MSLRSPSSSVVPDSEYENDSYDVFYNPSADNLYQENGAHNEVLKVNHTHHPESPKAQDSHEVPELKSISSGGRLLRKRKAIQKMPYSLERIRHQELLQGFDVTSFEDNCEQIVLPKSAVKDIFQGVSVPGPAYSRDRENLEGSRRAEELNSSGIATPRQRTVSNGNPELRSPDSIVNDIQEERKRDVEDEGRADLVHTQEQILFRGRVLNMKTGYRGVLPRVAWEKSLKKAANIRGPKRRKLLADQKGVAKRRLAPHKNNQDDLLLNDLIASDEDSEIEEENLYNLGNHVDPHYWHELEEYYKGKYMDDYLSEESSEPNELFERGNDIIDLEHNDDESPIRRPLYGSSPIIVHEQSEPGTAMTSFSNDKNRKSSQRSLYRHFLRDAGSPGFVHRSKRRVRAQNATSSRNTAAMSNKTDSKYVSRKSFTDDQPKINKNKSKKPGMPIPGIFPGPSSDLNRRANVFSTVVEALSSHYVSRGTRQNGVPPAKTQVFDKAHEESKNMPCGGVFDSLLTKKSIKAPDIVKIMLSNKQYTLSKLDDNGTFATLRNVFNHILNIGVTDIELVKLSDTLTLFLLYYNRPGIHEILSDFYKRFTFKVVALREAAKPIHFYQISLCQLMFLELSRCSDIANSFKTKLETTIIHNVVSFFDLISVCEEDMILSETNYLSSSYSLLAAIIKEIDAVERLWNLLGTKKVKHQVFFILLKLFPPKQENWRLLQLENRYTAMLNVLKIVNFCLFELNWPVTDELVLLFHRLYKTRRFENFSEEETMTTQNQVITSCRQEFVSKTIFNSYLAILRSTALSSCLVEKIVPISEVSENDSHGIVINRTNLLLALAENSSINLEKRVEQLLRPLLTAEYIKSKNKNSLEMICGSILSSSICLFEINAFKKYSFRAKTIVSCFKLLVFEREYLSNIWITFLGHLEKILEIQSHSYTNVLKDIYPCLLLMAQKKYFQNGMIILMRLYMRKLNELGPAWVEANLFQGFKRCAHESTGWIDYYCKIGQFLIEKQVISWWSFYMYNKIQGSSSKMLCFDHKIVQLCDSHSFDLIKKPLFSMAVDEILRNETTLFACFIKELLNREKGTTTSYDFHQTEANKLHVIKRLCTVMSALSYKDLMSKLISNIKKYYQNKSLTISFVKPLVEFLNSNHVDLIKSSHDFLFLKRELKISDKETDKSHFRHIFVSQRDPILRACYIEEGLIHASAIKEGVEDYMEKLSSLFSFPSFSDPFAFFSTLIEAHLVPNENNDLFQRKVSIGLYYLRLINDILISRYLQVEVNAFLELCKMHKTLCTKIRWSDFQAFATGRYFLFETMRYQLNVLRIADGFWELKPLMETTREFLLGVCSDGNQQEAILQLSSKIEEIISQSSDTCFSNDLDIDPFEQSKMESTLQEFIINRDIT
ncbi:hypothetical protein HG535_0E03690 [Zygotorulaspora mrakii]|uniref:Uncharacterized protein n=1 Tax=Zygotorulaspora mrakii TaxID=42260 RepID=A0A7H9B3N8_ZYGMR|nr:uncharacterized protein HG535_0E03690 [Zygotorulaspora mrakii]QLG73285.1 hypothetical protein HG535_0E03690 [Zygotorulaspora mrakii]